MKRTYFSFVLSLFCLSGLFAQEENSKITYKLSGFVRGDYSYDSRKSAAANEGLFFLYPLDIKPDDSPDGKDLNAVPNSGFYTFNSRVALDIEGLKLFNANVSGKIEADFAGFSGSSILLRLRRAFVKMNWQHSSLLLGQDWHPMFGGVVPSVLSLNTGAPFNPFNRSPQITFDYKIQNVSLTGSAIWELAYTSIGTNNVKSNIYQRYANIPEFYAGISYKYNGFSLGAGVDYLTIVPRTETKFYYATGNNFVQEGTLKVDESLGSLSFDVYAGYKKDLFSVSAKTILGQNNVDLCMLGGYGVKSINSKTLEQEYTNYKHSSTWLDVSYGKKYMGNLFLGYTKNLGTQDALVSTTTYGDGLNINELYRASASFSYNISKFSAGLEYEYSCAKYGEGNFNLSDGLYDKTHDVNGHRIMGVFTYYF